jgi:hypothetical protein
LALKATLARPCASVTAVLPEGKVPDAPVAGAVKVTVMPATGSPDSVSVA